KGGGWLSQGGCERGRVERVLVQSLVLVIEPPEPRRRAGGADSDADPVELHEIACHVRLDDGAVDPARGEVGEGLAHALGGVTEDEVAVVRVRPGRGVPPPT